MSKGSKVRPRRVDRNTYDANWEATFGRKTNNVDEGQTHYVGDACEGGHYEEGSVDYYKHELSFGRDGCMKHKLGGECACAACSTEVNND